MKTRFLLLVLLLFTLYTSAQTTGDTGDCTYTISADGTMLTISPKPGTDGKMADYAQSTDVPWYEFRSSLTTLVINEGVTTIGSDAFRDCSGFAGNLTIPASVTSIGEYSFSGCSGFTGNLVIPESVTSIGVGAFFDCSGFTGDLTIPEGVTSIGDGAFAFGGFTGSLTISENVIFIGNSAFVNCSGFTGSLTIPESVTFIGHNAFQDCSGFTGSLTIPEGVTSIGVSTFANCSGFTGNLTIPTSVTSIELGAFYNCSNISSISCYANNPPILKSSSFDNVPKTIPLRVPPVSVDLYRTAEYWEEFFNIMGIGQTGIAAETDNSIAVYPNPTKGMVYIQTEYNHLPEIKLYDMSGKLLMQAKDNQIDMTDFTNGTYILQFDNQKTGIIKQ